MSKDISGYKLQQDTETVTGILSKVITYECLNIKN